MAIEKTSQKVDYESADKEPLSKTIGEVFPMGLRPTKKINAIFIIIFIGVLVISAMQFPLSDVMNGQFDAAIKIGFPMHFLKLSLLVPSDSHILFTNLILDLLIYLALAYLIDIALNFVMNGLSLSNTSKLNQKPVVFDNQTPTVADKITEKILK